MTDEDINTLTKSIVLNLGQIMTFAWSRNEKMSLQAIEIIGDQVIQLAKEAKKGNQ